MKILAVLLLNLFSIPTYAQDINTKFDGHNWKAPYTLPIPKDWTIERFLIPISFAPQIVYNGIEDIRFTPGWSKVNNDAYWSYAFLWYLDGEVKINSEIIESNLKAYYSGLINANGSSIPSEKRVQVLTSFKETETTKGDFKTYNGTIQMLDYMQQKPITLNCKVHWKLYAGENKTFIFYELSPKVLSHTVWLSLDQLWIDFKCIKD